MLFGHGWVDLDPHQWEPERERLATVVELRRRAVDLTIWQKGHTLRLKAESASPLTPSERDELSRRVRRMLRLDAELAPFYALCRQHSDFAWVAERGAGRLLRAGTWFEDLAKLLLTTNCTWSQTRSMVNRLCQGLGRRSPAGKAAFPGPRRLAKASEAYLRNDVRVGYRARALLELSERFSKASTEAELDQLAREGDALRRALLDFKGLGPYAVGQALRLAGHYEDYALDSWCTATLKKRGQGWSPRALARRYGRFGEYRGLALWMDLTAPWHGEGPYAEQQASPLGAG